MSKRLLKELRPFLLYLVLGPIATFLMTYITGMSGIIFFAVVSLLGSVQIFTHEFIYQRMGWLLAQPISRSRIWLEKLTALGIYLVLLFSITFALGLGYEALSFNAFGEHYTLIINDDRSALKISRLPNDNSDVPMMMKPAFYYRNLSSNYGLLGRCFFYVSAFNSRFINKGTVGCVHLEYRQGHDDIIISRNSFLIIAKEQLFFLFVYMNNIFFMACGGFWMGMALRHSHTAFGAALVIPFGIAILWQFLWIIMGWSFQGDPELYSFILCTLWGVIALAGSNIHIKRLEV